VNLSTIRRWHTYVGLFIAPSVLFFALTGAAQLFSLHEAHGKYRPPALVEKLSSVHKDQVFASGSHHAEENPGDAGPQGDDDDDKVSMPTLMLKGFFLLVALCLALSTAFGMWMGLSQPHRQRVGWPLVIAGALIPLGLLLF
jgi:hypothetical protein